MMTMMKNVCVNFACAKFLTMNAFREIKIRVREIKICVREIKIRVREQFKKINCSREVKICVREHFGLKSRA